MGPGGRFGGGEGRQGNAGAEAQRGKPKPLCVHDSGPHWAAVLDTSREAGSLGRRRG